MDNNDFMPLDNDDDLKVWVVFPENCEPRVQAIEFCVEVEASTMEEAIEKARPLPWNEKNLGVSALEKDDFDLHFKDENCTNGPYDLGPVFETFIHGNVLPIVSFKYRVDNTDVEDQLVIVIKYDNSILKGYLINNRSKDPKVKETLRRFYRDKIVGDIKLLLY